MTQRFFAMMGRGHTAGVFQIESAGMTATIKGMQPREFKHVVALIALYRPGPLGAGLVADYIDRMNGARRCHSTTTAWRHPGRDLGTMVYQEQVMQISMKMCGFSAGESDSRIRKPVAKKKIKMLTDEVFHWEDGKDETIYDHWMNGAQENQYTRQIAQKIWDDVLEFASYAFNKSHSHGRLCHPRHADGMAEGLLPQGVHASVLTSFHGQDRQDRPLRDGGPSRGHPDPAARHQRVR
jgi:DNA polymerase-3 subunit alpha